MWPAASGFSGLTVRLETARFSLKIAVKKASKPSPHRASRLIRKPHEPKHEPPPADHLVSGVGFVFWRRPPRSQIRVQDVHRGTVVFMVSGRENVPPSYDPGAMGRRFFKAEKLNDLSAVEDNLTELSHEDRSNANLVSSLRADGTHAPAFDLDRKAVLLPSTTPGNHHLYIDEVLSWAQYRALLRGFYKAGLLDASVYWRSLYRGTTHVRPPWTRKTAEERSHGSIDSPADAARARTALRRVKVKAAARIVFWRLRESLGRTTP